MINQPYGLGAIPSPPDENDYPIGDLYAEAGIDPELLSIALHYRVSSPAPVLNQHDTPMCVAFSTSRMKSFQDRDDQVPPKWWNFDEPKQFRLIGGTSQGAVLRYGLDQILKVGYPLAVLGHPEKHKIKAYYAIPTEVMAIKRAITAFGTVVLGVRWHRSWFHPVNGILPSPDAGAGNHAITCDGWDDGKGLWLVNSWGTDWGVNGGCWLPYSMISQVFEAWKSIDAANAAPAPKRVFHLVKAGETLIGIAGKYKTTLKKLLAFSENVRYRKNPGLIHAGDKVRVK